MLVATAPATILVPKMGPGQPLLYMDPLLPLALRERPRFVPPVAGDAPAHAIVVCRSGSIRLGGLRHPPIRGPGIGWLTTSEPVKLQREAPAGGDAHGVECAWWLLVVGGRLIDQLIVGSFGEPGFCRFLESLATPGSAPTGPLTPELDDLLHRLAAELDDRPPAYRVRARSLLTDALLSIYRASLAADPASDGNHFRLASVIDHIELNYDQPLRLEALAALMRTSPTHFSRVFRREVGMPLFEYINRTRVRRACVLLRRTSLPVTRIAVDVGYNNVSFFNRYFRRIMRMSPRDYRRTVTQ